MRCSSTSSSTSPSLGFFGFKKVVAHVFVAAMSCIFSCFRVKDGSSPSSLKSSTPEETVVNRNRSPLSSLFISEENGSNSKEEKGLEEHDLYFEELKNQAKFLKACGTIPETPAEIKIVEAEKNGLSSHRGTVESLKFKSWLTYTSVEKLDLESQPDQLPKFNNDTEAWVDADCSEHTPSSCMTIDQNSERLSPGSNEGNVVLDAVSSELLPTLDHSSEQSSVSTSMTGPNIPCKNKSVRFDCELEMHSASSKGYSSETPIQTLTESGAAGHYSNVKPSPYPTPLKLSDEMQTPGTVFPAYMDDTGQGKYPRIRTQFVTHYAVNPGEHLSPLKALDEDSSSDQLNHHCQEPFEKAHESGEAKTGEISTVKDLIPDASKSPLPATKSPNQDACSAAKNIHRVKNPGDRRIIGLVAAHWNDNDPSRVSPKWWDGNGIPNSTNKYQEDQKVSWHATPFEERLEKALSEESLISQRRQSTGTSPPINFGETEESDTAMSQLQSSTHFKPVISF